MDLSGHIAIVTGAGSGVGAATAALLAKRGATVAAFGRREEPLRKAVSGFLDQSSVHVVDVSDPVQVAKAVADVVTKHGAPTLLVNAAGIDGPVALNDLTLTCGTSRLRSISPAASSLLARRLSSWPTVAPS
jgi:NAD(P)-dependent dehydrogenase (short-subunit alcohol dehydrogenase family)